VDGAEDWPRLSKADVAARLADRIVAHFAKAQAKTRGKASAGAS